MFDNESLQTLMDSDDDGKKYTGIDSWAWGMLTGVVFGIIFTLGMLWSITQSLK